MHFGGIEAGGTKFVCAIGNEKGDILQRIQIPTTVPEETIPQVISFFQQFKLDAIGIGSFGPIDVNLASPTYGNITTTPKPGWRNYPFVNTIKAAFDVPVGFHTDVNAAALGEVTLGAAKGLDNCLYMTIGTGIGAGAITNGQLLAGLSHPEMGHILVRRHLKDNYTGKCPYHGDCFEGLASGPAIEGRWGKKAHELADRNEVWEQEAFYIAQALVQYILILSPKRIILGGGVMKQTQVFPLIHKYVQEAMNGYVVFHELESGIVNYIVSPGLGDNAGIVGSLLLAERALQERGEI